MIEVIENSIVWQNPLLRGAIFGLFVFAFDYAKSKDLREAEFRDYYEKNDKIFKNFKLYKFFAYPTFSALALLFLYRNNYFLATICFVVLFLIGCASFLPLGRK